MSCINIGNAVVCRPSNRFLKKEVLRCPMCECRTEFAVRYEAWYGSTAMCCKCGDAWQDGELMPRPFAPGWRRKAIQKHRKLWDAATHGRVDFAELIGEAGAAA